MRDQQKSGILDVILRISDEEYQRDSWFGGGSCVSSPDELINELFDDYGFVEYLNSSALTTAQRIIGRELLGKLEAFIAETPEVLDPAVTFSDGRWADIRHTARRLLDAIR